MNRYSESGGLLLLGAALVFNAALLAPELRIGGLAWNDTTFHIAASERLVESVARGRPVSLRSARQEFHVFAAAPTVVEAATFHYPGWRVLVDGRATAVVPTADRGTISFHLSPGAHRIVLDLGPTPLRHGARLASAIIAALLLCIAALCVCGKRADISEERKKDAER